MDATSLWLREVEETSDSMRSKVGTYTRKRECSSTLRVISLMEITGSFIAMITRSHQLSRMSISMSRGTSISIHLHPRTRGGRILRRRMCRLGGGDRTGRKMRRRRMCSSIEGGRSKGRKKGKLMSGSLTGTSTMGRHTRR